VTERAPNDPEETLDPEDWGALRALGHRMVDDRSGTSQRCASGPRAGSAKAARARLHAPLPLEPEGRRTRLRTFVRERPALPDGQHPPRLGWVKARHAVHDLAEIWAAA